MDPATKCKTRGVSLPPELNRHASKRAFDADLSFSKYVRHLIELDLREGVLAKAITAKLNAPAQ